jgi:hypothetical protein
MDLQADIAEHKKRAEELARSLGIVASIDVAGYQRPNGGRYYVGYLFSTTSCDVPCSCPLIAARNNKSLPSPTPCM